MVTLKASYTVKPAKHTPIGVMRLSDFDQACGINHASTVYFYRPASDQLHVNAIDTLKDSLSKALVAFYPLAGRLQRIAEGQFEINCNSFGAQLVEAESDAKIDEFGDFRPSLEIRSLVPSVNYNSPIHERPLLLVQLTKFSCGGLSIGVAISHNIVDGQSACHFVAEWARIACGKQPENLPFLDRAVLIPEEPLPLPNFDLPEFSPPPILIGHSNDLEERKKETTVAMLKLSKEKIEILKNRANKARTNSIRSFSRFEAVAGHIWRCACKARMHKSEQPTRLRVAVDFRSRIEPPVSRWYFGNGVLQPAVVTTSGELTSNPLGYACGKIRAAVEKLTDEYLKSSLVFFKNQSDFSQGATFKGNPNIEITSWTGLPVFGADFGWGKPIYMGPATLGFEGKCIVLPGLDDGSFVVALRLQVAHIDAFKKFFYDDI